MNLSSKENILIKELLLAENFYLSREFILGSIWKYSSKSETNTIESHIHKLRSKVPYFNILVPTGDTVKYKYLLNKLV